MIFRCILEVDYSLVFKKKYSSEYDGGIEEVTHSGIAFKYFAGSKWTEGNFLGHDEVHHGKTLVEIGELILNDWESVILLSPVTQPMELVYIDSERSVFHFTTQFTSSDKLIKCFQRLQESESFIEPTAC